MDRPFASSPVAPQRTFVPRDYGSARELALQVEFAQQARRGPLDPDVLLGDGAVAPLRQSHHPATVLELADHAGPVSLSKPDRMRLDLDGHATGALDEGLHRLYVFTNAMRRSLPVHIYENVISVVTGEDALPVRFVPACEVELVHPFEIVRY